MGIMRNSRETCLKFLFQHEFLPQDFKSSFQHFMDHFTEPSSNDPDFARTLCEHVLKNIEHIDSQISSFLDHWKLSRIALVDLLLLRMAFCEIQLKLTPFKVVIDETLEIAKKYSSEDSSRFINGVLDQWTKKLYSHKDDLSD